MKQYLVIFRDAVIAALLMAVIGLVINAVRSDGLPFIADKPYDIFVPCPEALGTVEMISVKDARLTDGSSFIVDARTSEEFEAWHMPDALCLTYDYLEPISDEELDNVSRNIIRSGKARLVVYGDGDGGTGSSGYELGRELAGKGIQAVFVVEGGAEALQGVHHD